jgi:guanylate kinase
MKIFIHNNSLTQLAARLGTDSEDCAAWIEELLSEIREEDFSLAQSLFDKLGDNLYPEQVSLLAQQLIEHYSKEEKVKRTEITGLIYNLKITSND